MAAPARQPEALETQSLQTVARMKHIVKKRSDSSQSGGSGRAARPNGGASTKVSGFAPSSECFSREY
ncbi:hypothetical protein SPHINGOT1_20077 [Sphingomonas sp. T1]|nr:hypothetical protein SPHINGOT1_20077 [Sphingomonas sp. T1]